MRNKIKNTFVKMVKSHLFIGFVLGIIAATLFWDGRGFAVWTALTHPTTVNSQSFQAEVIKK